MKKIFVAYSIIITMFSGSDPKDKIEGVWLTHREQSKIEIYREGDLYFGKIVWLERYVDGNGEPVKDKYNPDPDLRNRPIVGINTLQNLEYKDEKWVGQIYVPRRGSTMDVEITLEDDDKLKVSVSRWRFTSEMQWTRDSTD